MYMYVCQTSGRVVGYEADGASGTVSPGHHHGVSPRRQRLPGPRLSCPARRLNGGERVSMQVEDVGVGVGVDERDAVRAAESHLDLARPAHASHDQLACTRAHGSRTESCRAYRGLGWLFLQLLPLVSNNHMISLSLSCEPRAPSPRCQCAHARGRAWRACGGWVADNGM